jgi:hypothetical protein
MDIILRSSRSSINHLWYNRDANSSSPPTSTAQRRVAISKPDPCCHTLRQFSNITWMHLGSMSINRFSSNRANFQCRLESDRPSFFHFKEGFKSETIRLPGASSESMIRYPIWKLPFLSVSPFDLAVSVPISQQGESHEWIRSRFVCSRRTGRQLLSRGRNHLGLPISDFEFLLLVF